jgi:putative PEP-CTERM system histidine kinase
VNATIFATATAWSYGLALTGYVIVLIRVSRSSRKSAGGRLLLAMLSATAVWAAACLALSSAPTNPKALFVASVADLVRYAGWFAFLRYLVYPSGRNEPIKASRRLAPLVGVAIVLAAAALLGEGSPLRDFVAPLGPRAGFLLRIILAIFGLALIEQLWRRIQPQTRWSIKPLAIAATGVFGLDLFYYADAMLFGYLDVDIWVARGLANGLLIPLLAIATARNTGWSVDLHVSRDTLFHSTALLISGAFLLAAAGAGYYVRYFGGAWGVALQIELSFAAILLLALVASSGRFRSKLKVFVSKHFFSYRYDYRAEWLRFTRTLSTESSLHTLQVRSIIGLADLVESPSGMLFERDATRGFVSTARWNVPQTDAVEPVDGSLGAFLQRTSWVVCVADYRRDPTGYAGLVLPEWLASFHDAWLVIPLASGPALDGFVVLTTPRTAIDVDWEVRDLLKTASRQASSYLGQVRTSEALLEARKFDAFNRMSAFVVHDLKNLVTQLSLMLKNAKRHRDNPKFQADMLETVAHVVERMNRLMLQLRTGTEPIENRRHVDLQAIVRRVCTVKTDSRVAIEVATGESLVVAGHEDRIEHVIAHLVQNAVDASPPGARITADLRREGTDAVLRIRDQGAGMSDEFMRERLFKPFQTTKRAGMGIGVYESHQYVTAVGGSMHFDSSPGTGTCVEVRLPLGELPLAASSPQAAEERVA